MKKNYKLKIFDHTIMILKFYLLSAICYLPSAYACPGCSDLLERGKEALQAFKLAQGINWSILFMLSMPYLVVGTIAFLVTRSYRKSRSNGMKV